MPLMVSLPLDDERTLMIPATQPIHISHARSAAALIAPPNITDPSPMIMLFIVFPPFNSYYEGILNFPKKRVPFQGPGIHF